MKLKKYFGVGLVSTLLLSCMVVTSAYNSVDTIAKYNKQVQSSFEKILYSDGIDFVKVTFDNGQWTEIYRDTDNLFERVDFYNNDGNFISRTLTTDGGASMINIGIDSVGTMFEGEPIATRFLQPKSVANQNSELLKVSMIDSYFTIDVANGLDLDWKLTNSKDEKVDKYTSKDGNVYIDKSNNELIKREVIVDEEVSKTIEYDKIHIKNNENLNAIFSIEAPLSTEIAKKTINLHNIKVEDFNVE